MPSAAFACVYLCSNPDLRHTSLEVSVEGLHILIKQTEGQHKQFPFLTASHKRNMVAKQ